jgi:AcrR family transcriptional regulator
MNQAGLAEAIVPEGTESAPQPAAVRTRVAAYWRDLGLSDPALIESLTDDCLNRAWRRMGRGSEEELLRRALEEAQRRFDHALARALRLPPARDPHPIAAARAALLLSENRLLADRLFQSGDPALDLGAQLQEILPRSTPPEAPLPMSEAPLRFWLFKSPPH